MDLESNREAYEQELRCKDQVIRHMDRELKEKDQENKRLKNVGQSSTEWEEKYDEIKSQMDYQLQEKERRYEELLRDYEDLQFQHGMANEEIQYRKAEMVQLRQAYEKNAINMVNRWTKEKQEYDARIEQEQAEKIREMTSKVDQAIEEASKIYGKIQVYREENIGGQDHPHSLTAFLDEILLLASQVESIIRK